MAVKVINAYNDRDFEEIANMFYNHFSPDDWDYIIIGEDKTEVDNLANKLTRYEYNIEPITVDGVATWVAVTYHS